MRSEPTEAAGVIGVSSVGPINLTQSPFPRKAYYSNYGLEQTDVSAPGGERREFFGTPHYNAPENRILVPYPLNVAVRTLLPGHAPAVRRGRREHLGADRLCRRVRRRADHHAVLPPARAARPAQHRQVVAGLGPVGARYGGTVAAAGQLESSVDVIWVAAAIATALPLLVVGVHLSRQGR